MVLGFKLTSALEPPDNGNDVSRRRNITYGWPSLGDPTSKKVQYHQVTAVWDENVRGPPAEVEVSIKSGPEDFNNTGGNRLEGSGVVVRAEEALIVILVLILWVAAIALFFNRWGKIRMLEPYQPKFQQQHRQSCAMIESQSVLPHRTSFSRTCLGESSLYASLPPHPLIRPRQNSVFVGSMSTMAFIPENPPRKSKSAMDIQSLVLAEENEEQRSCGRTLSRCHSPATVGFVPGNSLGVPCVGYAPFYPSVRSPSSTNITRGTSLGGIGSQNRLSHLSTSPVGRHHRNSICVERPTTSRGTYLTVTNV